MLTNIVSVNVPGVYVELSARSGSATAPHEAFLAGQSLSSGTMTAGEVYPVDSAADGVVLAGPGSQLSQLITAYRSVDTTTPLSVVGVADSGSGTAAVGTITLAGTATAAGTLAIYIGGQRIVVGVAVADTAATVTAKVIAAAANAANLPATVTDVDGDITITARHKGSIGSAIAIAHSQVASERPPAGITVTVVPMAGGAGDPSYAGVISAMGDEWYQTVGWGLSDITNVQLLVTELTRRWSYLAQIDGCAFVGKSGSRADISTYAANFNSGSLYVIPSEQSALMLTPWETAAQVAAASALQAQVDPALQPIGDVLPGSHAARRANRFTFDQRNTLLGSGVSTLAATSDGRLAIERIVSTYRTNAAGLADTALRDLNKVRLLSALRFSFRAMMASKYRKAKLMDDSPVLPSGQTIVTPDLLRAEIIALYAGPWTQAGWVEAGALEQFKKELVVERDQSDSTRINALIPPDLMDVLLITAANISAVG